MFINKINDSFTEYIINDKILIYDNRNARSYIMGLIEFDALCFFLKNDALHYNVNGIDINRSDLNRIISFEESSTLHKQHRFRGNILKFQIPIFRTYDKSLINSQNARLLKAIVSILFIVAVIISVCSLGKLSVAIDSTRHISFTVKNIFYLYFFTVVSVAAHEIAHGITAEAFGGKVTEFGIMFVLFIPLIYTKMCGLSQLKKNHRLYVFLAGPFANLFIASFLLLFPLEYIKSCVYLGIVLNIVFCLSNLIFYIKLDGYYIIEVLLGIDKLMERALHALKHKFKNTDYTEVIIYSLYLIISLLTFFSYIFIFVFLIANEGNFMP